MDLSNTIRQDSLVILKEGVTAFTLGHTEFKPDTFYRAINLSLGKHREVLVYGELFIGQSFDEFFEVGHNKIMRDFKKVGLVNEVNEPIGVTKFCNHIDIHVYGKGQDKLFKGYLCINDMRYMYSFQSFFRQNKKDFKKEIYNHFKSLVEGNLNPIDNQLVRYGNSGIGLTYNVNLKVR